MPKHFVYGILFLVGFVVSCSSLGTQYAPVKTIPEGQSLVYIFYSDNKRPGRSPNFVISDSEKYIVTLEEGGYYPYFVKSGELTLASKLSFKYGTSGLLDVVMGPKNTFKCEIISGRTYYLEGVPYYVSEAVWGLNFNQIIDEFQAQLMLEECKLLPEYKETTVPEYKRND